MFFISLKHILGRYTATWLSPQSIVSPSCPLNCRWTGKWNILLALLSQKQPLLMTQNFSKEQPGRKCQSCLSCKCSQGNTPYKAGWADSSTTHWFLPKLLHSSLVCLPSFLVPEASTYLFDAMKSSFISFSDALRSFALNIGPLTGMYRKYPGWRLLVGSS